jgi:hypothetical protein
MPIYIKEPRRRKNLVANLIALLGSVILMGGPLLVYALFFGVL